MRSSALPFFSSRSRIAEAIYDIGIYDLNESQSEICLASEIFSSSTFRRLPGGTGAVPSHYENCADVSLPKIMGRDSARPSRLNSYSVRNAAMGLIRVALRAGSQVATNVAAPRISGAVENA